MKPYNIKVRFGEAVVTLADSDTRVTTREGVEIYMVKRAARNYQAYAEIPDGTLEQYKHCKPKVISVEWR